METEQLEIFPPSLLVWNRTAMEGVIIQYIHLLGKWFEKKWPQDQYTENLTECLAIFQFFVFFLNIYSSIWVQFLILINSTIIHFNTHAIHLNLNSNFPYSVQPLTHQIYYGHWLSASTCSGAFFIFCCIHFDVYACTCVYMCVHLCKFKEIFEGMWRDMWRALLIIEHKLWGRLNNGPQRYLDPSPWNLCYLTW